MHIEPGLVDGAKILLSYVTAAGAGAYAIQGPFGAFIPWINGSFTGVVGLPLTETLGLLTAAGLAR